MARRYPPEFRRKVLDLLQAGRTVRQVAFDLQRSGTNKAPGPAHIGERAHTVIRNEALDLRSPPTTTGDPAVIVVPHLGGGVTMSWLRGTGGLVCGNRRQ